MANNKISLTNPFNGHMKEAPVGFSWTLFFFGPFVPLLRGNWEWALIMLIAACCSFGLSWLVFMFIYNKMYVKRLLGRGFKVHSVNKGTVEQMSQRLQIDLPILEKS